MLIADAYVFTNNVHETFKEDQKCNPRGWMWWRSFWQCEMSRAFVRFPLSPSPEFQCWPRKGRLLEKTFCEIGDFVLASTLKLGGVGGGRRRRHCDWFGGFACPAKLNIIRPHGNVAAQIWLKLYRQPQHDEFCVLPLVG